MRKYFDLTYKITVVVLLIAILVINIQHNDAPSTSTYSEPNEIGRFKEITIDGVSRILDTKTGECNYPKTNY